jgi:hypothetical protein
MNISEWQAGLTLAMVVLGVWGICRAWYGRRLRSLQRQLAKLDASQQNALRLGAQARKQIEELQRLTAEYRRRLTAAELGRRSRPPAKPVPVLDSEPEPAAAGAPPRMPPGGWADTQPM